MATLNHVCMLSEHGWERITAEEAASKHPGGTVSASGGLFMCELCNQYVTFTAGDKQVRSFRHSSGESDKTCPERTFGTAYTPTYNAREHELPIKLVLDRNDFIFEIGLLFIPESVLKRQPKKSVTIKTSEGKQFVFSFERLHKDTITYLQIGGDPSSKYEIIAPKELEIFWPQEVKGIDYRGSVFDCITGKMLPYGSDVQINKKYYLLTTASHSVFYRNSSVRINPVNEKRVGGTSWHLYEIEATAINRNSATFFFSLHCRLTDKPLRMQPIWPIHIETPYVIKHLENYLIMHLAGERSITPRAFPQASIRSINCAANGQAIKIICNTRQQLISAGSTNVLQYAYLWKEDLNDITTLPSIEVLDGVDVAAENGEQFRLPKAGIMKICTPFDGVVIISTKDRIIEKRKIASDKRVIIDGIRYGFEIQILQGLDIVWQASYVKINKLENDADDVLNSKLQSFRGSTVQVNHSIGSMAKQLAGYPKTIEWIYTAIKNGFAAEKALKYLRNYIIITNQQRGESQ